MARAKTKTTIEITRSVTIDSTKRTSKYRPMELSPHLPSCAYYARPGRVLHGPNLNTRSAVPARMLCLWCRIESVGELGDQLLGVSPQADGVRIINRPHGGGRQSRVVLE